MKNREINREALKFFFMMVDEATIRTRYYNGEKNMLAPSILKEEESRRYMNEVLQKLRDMGWENIPADIPQRRRKEKDK